MVVYIKICWLDLLNQKMFRNEDFSNHFQASYPLSSFDGVTVSRINTITIALALNTKLKMTGESLLSSLQLIK